MSDFNRRLPVYGLIAIMLVLTFRLPSSYTLDETGMIYLLSLPLREAFLQYTENLPMLSFFEIFMWIWLRLFGLGEFVARLPSFFCFFSSLFVLRRLVQETLVGHPAKEPLAAVGCLIFAANPFIQHFATTARPYSMAILFCSLSLLYFFRWRNSGRLDFFWWSSAWLALASAVKVFAAIQLLFFVPVILSGGGRRRLFECMVLAFFPIIVISAQLPMIIHFQKQAFLHQFSGTVDFSFFRDLVLEAVFPPSTMVPIIVIALAGWFALKLKVSLNSSNILVLLWFAVAGPLLLGIISWKSSVVIASEKYVFASYVPAVLLGTMFLSLARVSNVLMALLVVYIGSAGCADAVTMASDVEDWRRAFAIARSMETSSPLRAPVLLLNSGFFEAQHKEFEADPFVEAPAKAYPISGEVIAIPDYPRPGMVKWVEENLLNQEAINDRRPIVLIAKKPSQSKAILLSNMLDRRVTGIEFSQTQIWLLYR